MALSVYQWQEPDVTGVVSAYLRGLAIKQQQQEMQQKAFQDMASNILKSQALAQEHQDRLDKAEALRQKYADANAPFVSPYGSDSAASAASTPAGYVNSPTVAAPVVEDAGPVSGTPAVGGDIIQAANAGANAALPDLSLQQANPNAAPITLPAPDFGGDAGVTPADQVLAGKDDFSTPVDLLTAANATGGEVPRPIEEGWKQTTGTQFGLVRNGNGGLMTDAQDRVDAAKGIKGFDPNRGAYGANIKDPNLLGVALTPAEMRANGLDPNNPKATVDVSANGKIVRGVPIVDKLGTPGKVDLTGGLYAALDGPDSPKGSIDGLKYRIVPNDDLRPAPGTPAAAALPPGQDAASQIIAAGEAEKRRLASDLQRRGVSRKDGNAALSLVDQKTAAAVLRVQNPTAAAGRPIVRSFADGTTRQYDPGSGTWNVVASGSKIDPNSQQGVDAAVEKAKRIAEAKAGTPATPDEIASKATDYGLRPSADGTGNFIHDDTGMVMQYDQRLGGFKPVKTAQQFGTQDEQIAKEGLKPGPYPNSYVNKDGALYSVEMTGTGRIKTHSYMDKMVVKTDPQGNLVRVMPDNTTTIITPAAAMPKGPAMTKYIEDVKSLTAAQADYDAKKAVLDQKGSGWIGGNQRDVDAAEKKLNEQKATMEKVWKSTFSGLRAKAETDAPAKISTAEEYAALPSGTTYVDPAGVTRKKP